MHRCLLLFEIFDRICTEIHFDDEQSWSPRARSLSTLAQTCISFKETALNHLWSEISNLTPLIRCMPKDLWFSENNFESLQIIRPVVASDWPRFFEYSWRVKSIGIRQSRFNPDLGIDAHKTLQLGAISTGPLLPNVCDVYWIYSKPGTLPLLEYYMGPKVTALALWLEPSGEALPHDYEYLQTLSSRYPSIQKVRCAENVRWRTELGAVAAAVCGWAFLDTLEVNCLSSQVVKHAATLPRLRKLVLTYADDHPELANFPVIQSPAFPALQILIMEITSLSLCTALLGSTQDCDLRELSVFFYKYHTAEAWGNLFSALRGHCTPSALRTLRLCEHHMWADYAGKFAPPTITIDLFQPLFSFPNLTILELEFQGFDPDDLAIEEIALAWPRLNQIHIHPALAQYQLRKTLPPPRATLQGLSHLIEHCQDLRHMFIYFDGARGAGTGPRPSRTTTQFRFNVGISPGGDPDEIARHLLNIFSGGLDLYCLTFDLKYNVWSRVKFLVDPKRIARKSVADGEEDEKEDEGDADEGEADEDEQDENEEDEDEQDEGEDGGRTRVPTHHNFDHQEQGVSIFEEG